MSIMVLFTKPLRHILLVALLLGTLVYARHLRNDCQLLIVPFPRVRVLSLCEVLWVPKKEDETIGLGVFTPENAELCLFSVPKSDLLQTVFPQFLEVQPIRPAKDDQNGGCC